MPPPHPNFQFFSLSPNLKLQNTPPSKFPNFFPKSKSEVTEYPPQISSFFSKSKSEVTEHPKLNLNNKNIFLHWFITFPEGVYGGKGGKHGTFLIWTYGKKSWKFGFLGWGGAFCNFGFGLREKSWKFGIWGGYSVTSDLDLGEKVGNLELGGVFCNFGFRLREKSWKFEFSGGGGYSGKVMEKKKKPTLQKN